MKHRRFFWAILILCFFICACQKEDENEQNPASQNEIKPVANNATRVHKSNFLASWEMIENASGYEIDVSTSNTFDTHVAGFENKNAGLNLQAFVFGLQASTDYYYRVRFYKGDEENPSYSQYSNIVKVSTNNNDQLPNMDMEVWLSFERYEVPAPIGIWATPNKVADLLVFIDPPPVSVVKTEDAVSGRFAAKITTIQPEDFFLMAGTLATGKFEPDLGNPVKSLQQGVPFTSKPLAFGGYYKYLPINEDSCKLYALLSKWNTSTSKRDTVAWAGLPQMNEYPSEYTAFQFDFEYYLEGVDPDTLIMIMVSSAEGDQFIGGIGSSLYIDDLKLIYE